MPTASLALKVSSCLLEKSAGELPIRVPMLPWDAFDVAPCQDSKRLLPGEPERCNSCWPKNMLLCSAESALSETESVKLYVQRINRSFFSLYLRTHRGEQQSAVVERERDYTSQMLG